MSDDDILIKISKDIGEVSGKLSGVEREVSGVRKEVRGLNVRIGKMPEEWRKDASDIVEGRFEQQDKIEEKVDRITAVTNLERERARAKAERGKPRYSVPPRRNSWIGSAVKEGLKPFITMVVFVAMTLAISLGVTRCGNGEPVDRAMLKETQHTLERVKAELKKVNGNAKVP